MNSRKISYRKVNTKYNYGTGETHEERFWSRVANKENPHDCWDWLGYIKPNGYAGIRIHYRKYYVHRYAWFLATGEMPPPDVEIAHSCDNRKCVNPSHLFKATHTENMLDMFKKNRQAKGEQMNRNVLTEKDVLEIRELLKQGVSQYVIAKQFNTNQPNISFIKTKKSWKHI